MDWGPHSGSQGCVYIDGMIYKNVLQITGLLVARETQKISSNQEGFINA